MKKIINSKQNTVSKLSQIFLIFYFDRACNRSKRFEFDLIIKKIWTPYVFSWEEKVKSIWENKEKLLLGISFITKEG